MTEHAIKHGERDVEEKKPERNATWVVRQIVQWGLLALLLFTCIMAAYRKFGG